MKEKINKVIEKLGVALIIAISFFLSIGAAYIYSLNDSEYLYISDMLIKSGIIFLLIHAPLMFLLDAKDIKKYVSIDILSSLFFLPFLVMRNPNNPVYVYPNNPVYDYLILLAIPIIMVLIIYTIYKKEMPIMNLCLITILLYVLSIYGGHLQGLVENSEEYFHSDFRVVMFVGIQVTILLTNLIYIVFTKKSLKELISGASLIILGAILFAILNNYLNPFVSGAIIVGALGIVLVVLLGLDKNYFKDYLPGINIALVSLMIFFIIKTTTMKLSFDDSAGLEVIGNLCYGFLLSSVIITVVLFLEQICYRRDKK